MKASKIALEIGDTVYLPVEDPGCEAIYTVQNVNGGLIRIWHPIKGERTVTFNDIAESLF